MDNLHRKLKREFDRLVVKSVKGKTSAEEDKRIDQLLDYLVTVDEIDATLEQVSESHPDLDKEQCYSVYEY